MITMAGWFRGSAHSNRRKTGQASVIVFILVPQVALKKRLDVEGATNRQAARVPSLIARHWRWSFGSIGLATVIGLVHLVALAFANRNDKHK